MLIDKLDVLNTIGELFTICSETLPNENGKRYVTEEELVEFYHSIIAIPTIDAVPVVHGEWRQHKKGGIYCSACKHDNHYGSVRQIMSYVVKFPFCPYCGAVMDGKEKENV